MTIISVRLLPSAQCPTVDIDIRCLEIESSILHHPLRLLGQRRSITAAHWLCTCDFSRHIRPYLGLKEHRILWATSKSWQYRIQYLLDWKELLRRQWNVLPLNVCSIDSLSNFQCFKALVLEFSTKSIVTRAWENLRKFCPVALLWSLNPGIANDSEVAAAEAALGCRLPAGLRASLAVHDGQRGGDFLGHPRLLSARELRRLAQEQPDLLRETMHRGRLWQCPRPTESVDGSILITEVEEKKMISQQDQEIDVSLVPLPPSSGTLCSVSSSAPKTAHLKMPSSLNGKPASHERGKTYPVPVLLPISETLLRTKTLCIDLVSGEIFMVSRMIPKRIARSWAEFLSIQ